jgi:hypothetical protein
MNSGRMAANEFIRRFLAARTVRPGREVDSNHRSRPQPRGLSKPLRIALWTTQNRSAAADRPTPEPMFADSPLEETGFEPLVPLRSQHNRGTGP